MLKSAALCGSIAALAALPVPVSAFEDEEIIIRCEEDYIRGRENVRTVMEELIQLFADDSPIPEVRYIDTPHAMPYCRVVPGTEGRCSLIFRPRFTSAKKMFRVIDGMITGTAFTEYLEDLNVIVINAHTEEVDGYRELLIGMDIPTPQVLIEAKIVEVLFNEGMQRNLSFNFQGNRYNAGASAEVPGVTNQPNTGLGGNFTPYSGNDTMNVAFQWLMTAQDAKVLSSPNILISSAQKGRIKTGEEIPIQEANTSGNTLSLSTKFKSVGVSLEVEPSLINIDNVTLRVLPEVSNVVRYETVSAGAETSFPVPVISARSVETYLRLHDKQVIMMGGLYNSRNTLQQQRIPFLSDIPFVGELFTGKNLSKEVTQLIFFLKIHIIAPDQLATGIYYDFDQNGKLSEKIGEIIVNSDSFPVHETSVEKFVEEVVEALPGKQRERREAFKELPISLDSPVDYSNVIVLEPAGGEPTPVQPMPVDNVSTLGLE